MTINGIGYSQNDYYNTNHITKSLTAGSGEVSESMLDLISEELQEGSEIETGRKQRQSGIPEKGTGAPYSYLADESGVIEYNGVTFVCDNERRWLCLGDMSNLEDVIRIPMSEGGCLMVNRDNIGELSQAIGMFSPEDINRILRALKLDAKIQQMKKEVEEMEDGIGKNSAQECADSDKEAEQVAKESGKTNGFNGYESDENNGGVTELTQWQLDMLLSEKGDDLIEILNRHKEEIIEKIKRGETEPSFALGADSYTMKQWEKFLRTIDRAIEDMQKRNEEAKEEQEEYEEKKEENSLTFKVFP